MLLSDFSVSMCVYGKDNPAYFRDAVNSILEQTVKPSEVVLVVDGPVPQELDYVIKDFESNPIFKIVRLSQNMGHGVARRIGFANCTNELVAIADADDVNVLVFENKNGTRTNVIRSVFNEEGDLNNWPIGFFG